MDYNTQTRIDYCDRCLKPIEADALTSGEQVILVKCSSCERRYYLAAQPGLSAQLVVSESALLGFSPSRHLTSQRSSRIENLITESITAAKQDERRLYARVQVSLSLMVVPLDFHFRPVSIAYDAVGVDINSQGISFVVPSNCGVSYWLVDYSDCLSTGFQAVMKVVRMEPWGEGSWKVAGPFASVTAAAHLTAPIPC